ncbi:hypothetical protein [Cryobacterium sp. Y62]|uniref:hypothetical protein n=1 Tax=Cryobacterium sp. Y62 TaxID=2048284 RepID=UPI001304902C|nr:hypothetical protein [Cryobacterium sp. Y62]
MNVSDADVVMAVQADLHFAREIGSDDDAVRSDWRIHRAAALQRMAVAEASPQRA